MQETTTLIKRNDREVPMMTLNTFLQDLIINGEGDDDGDEGLLESGGGDYAHALGSSKRSLPLTLDIVDDNARLTEDQVQTIRTCRSFSGYEMALRKQNLHQGKGNSKWDTTGGSHGGVNDSSSSSESDNFKSTSATGGRTAPRPIPNRTGSFDSALNIPARRESIEAKTALGALNLMWDKVDDEFDDYDSDIEDGDCGPMEVVPTPHGSILKSVDSASLMRNVIMHHDHDSSSNISHNATFDADSGVDASSSLVVSKAARGDMESKPNANPSKQRTPSFLELCQQAAEDHLGSTTAAASQNSEFSEQEFAVLKALNNPGPQEIPRQQQQRAPSFLELCQQAAQDHVSGVTVMTGTTQNSEFSEEELAAALAINNSAPPRQEVQQQQPQRAPSFLELCQQAAQDHLSSATATIGASQNSGFSEEEQLAAALALNSSTPPKQETQQQRTPSFLELCAQSARDNVKNSTSSSGDEPSVSASHNYVQPHMPSQPISSSPRLEDQSEQRIPSFMELCTKSAQDHISNQTPSTIQNETITINMSNDSASNVPRPQEQQQQQAADHITSASGKVSLTPAMLKALRASGALSQKPGGAPGGFMGKNAPSSLKNAMLMASSSSSGNVGGLGGTKSFPPPGMMGTMSKNGPPSAAVGGLSSISDHGTARMYGSQQPSFDNRTGGNQSTALANAMLSSSARVGRHPSRNDMRSVLSSSMMSSHAAQNANANNHGAYSSSPALQNAMLAARNAMQMPPTSQRQHHGGRVGAGMGSGTSSSPSLKNAMLSANAAAVMMTSPKGSMGSRGLSNPALRNAMLSASTPTDYQMQMLLMQEKKLQEQQMQQQNMIDRGDAMNAHGITPNAYDRSSIERSFESSASVFTTPHDGNKAFIPVKKGTHVDESEAISRIWKSRASHQEEEEALGRAANRTEPSPSRWSATPASGDSSSITHSRSCDSFLTIPNRLDSPASTTKPSLSTSTSVGTRGRGVRRAKSGSDADRGTVRKPLRRRLKKDRSDRCLRSQPNDSESSGGGKSAPKPLKQRPLLGRVRVVGDPNLHRSFRRQSRFQSKIKSCNDRQATVDEQQMQSRWSRSDSCDSFLKIPTRQLSPGTKQIPVKTVRDDIEEFRKRKDDCIRVSKLDNEQALPELTISSLFCNYEEKSPSALDDPNLHRSFGDIHQKPESRWSPAASMARSGSCDSFLKPPDRKTSLSKLPRPPVRKRGRKPQKKIKESGSDPSLVTKTANNTSTSGQQEDGRWTASHTPTHSGSCDSFLKQPMRQSSARKHDSAKSGSNDPNGGSGNAQWSVNDKVKRKGNTLIVPLGCDINKVLALKRPSDRAPSLGSSRSSPSLGRAQRHSSKTIDSVSEKSIRAALGGMAPKSSNKKSSSSSLPRRGPGGDLRRCQSTSRRRIRTMRSLGELDPITETGSHRPLDENIKVRSFGDFKLARQKSLRERRKVKVELARSRRDSKGGGSDNSLNVSSHKKNNQGLVSNNIAQQNARW